MPPHQRLLDVDRAPQTALNRICAYFTMFPLWFPHGILARRAAAGERVLDPFCGRGTTNYAARLLGLDSVGVDSSPVAAAIAAAKLVAVTPEQVVDEFDCLTGGDAVDVPDGEFWHYAYAPRTLATICRLRRALLIDCSSDVRIALRAILLGALHGPAAKESSYLSNQAPRTFAPKPGYAVKFWATRGLEAEERNVRQIVVGRSQRYFGNETTPARGRVIHGDSREDFFGRYDKFDWVITSPPYYGMRTYVPDQWIRNWFMGGPPTTDYSPVAQLRHLSPDKFAADLGAVWKRAANAAREGARLVMRFGGINDRSADPRELARASLDGSGWRLVTVRFAGTASKGKRQALAFAAAKAAARDEYDFWATRA